MNVLIIQHGTPSQALLTAPLIQALHEKNRAEITLSLRTSSQFLFRENPHISSLISLSESIDRRKLKKKAFDYVIDLSNTLNTRWRRMGFHGKKIVYKKQHSFREWLYIICKIGTLNQKQLSEQYLELLNLSDLGEADSRADFYIPEKDEVENSWLPSTHQAGYALIAVSASHETKKLPQNRLIELCDRINKPIILIGAKEDEMLCEEIAAFFKQGTAAEEKAIEKLNKKTTIFNGCGKFNFNQQASLIRDANWVFSFDSMYMHVAAAFQKKLYTIWGSSTPLFGEYPHETQFTIFENNKLSCRPCARSGYANCPKGHFKCMQEVTFDFYLPDE